MNQQKELILYQLANLINSMCYYEIPAKKWDGSPYPNNLPEPAEALRETGEIEYFPRGSDEYDQRPTEIVIPTSLLSKAAELVAVLDDMDGEND